MLNDNKEAKRKGHRGHKKVKYCYVLPYLIAGIDLQDKLSDSPAYNFKGYG